MVKYYRGVLAADYHINYTQYLNGTGEPWQFLTDEDLVEAIIFEKAADILALREKLRHLYPIKRVEAQLQSKKRSPR